MLHKFLLTAMLLFIAIAVLSQDQSSTEQSTTVKTADHYVGVQVNQLMKQILNLSNSNTTINNPYVLMYSVNSKLTGIGVNFGLRYNFNNITDDDDTQKRETKVDDLFLRAGIEKKTSIAKNLLISYGFDVLYSKQKDFTKATVEMETIKTVTETEDKTKGWGMGPRFTLQYAISSKVLIGTEATYYFKSDKTESSFKTSSTQTQGGQSTTTTDKIESDHENKRVEFTAPIVLLLTLKF